MVSKFVPFGFNLSGFSFEPRPLTYWQFGQCPQRKPSDSPTFSTLDSFLSDKELRSKVDWNDRRSMQSPWTLKQKGWRVNVVHGEVPGMGMGAVADQDIATGTVMRVAESGKNLQQFRSREDLEAFIERIARDTRGGRHALNRYIADYVAGIRCLGVDFHYMLFPGNGINHSASAVRANTLMVPVLSPGAFHGIRVVAIRDMKRGDPLFYDYQIQGDCPLWFQRWVQDNEVESAFPGTNDYVAPLAAPKMQ